MNPIVYDLSTTAGLGLITAGTWQQHGAPVAMQVAGAGIIALSIIASLIGRGGRR